MAITPTRYEELGTPDSGVFFWDHEKALDQRSTIDDYAFDELIPQIKSCVDAIADKKIDNRLKPDLRTVADSLGREYCEAITQSGHLLIAAPEALRAYSGLDKLLPDYKQLDDADLPTVDQTHILAIPTAKITSTQLLPGIVGSDSFDPVLNLRVQTSGDKPLAIYDITQPDHVRYEDNPGNWYSLPLNYIELKLKSEQNP